VRDRKNLGNAGLWPATCSGRSVGREADDTAELALGFGRPEARRYWKAGDRAEGRDRKNLGNAGLWPATRLKRSVGREADDTAELAPCWQAEACPTLAEPAWWRRRFRLRF
jgi:hypothetical protein